VAVVCAASTVNFGLLSPAERAGLVAGFAGWLNSLTGPVQILINADRIDLAPLIRQLAEDAPGLPDPALEEAALAHARWLAELAATRDLPRRRVPPPRGGPRGPGGRADRCGAGTAPRGRSRPRAGRLPDHHSPAGRRRRGRRAVLDRRPLRPAASGRRPRRATRGGHHR